MQAPALPSPVGALVGLAAIALVGLAIYRASGGTIAAASQAAGQAAVDAAGGAVAGVAQGVGDAVGLPRTNQSACDAALQAGDRWAASFACPASTFLRASWASLWGNTYVIDESGAYGK